MNKHLVVISRQLYIRHTDSKAQSFFKNLDLEWIVELWRTVGRGCKNVNILILQSHCWLDVCTCMFPVIQIGEDDVESLE